ncbi:hypothetical protein DUNSADRAFT_773 [Dunaliella salina]|uniref:Encoded protein n=1 Tax=Dunaliella salina TaxID=3046 RepID=A0ABQ7FYM5_DUNSA|nr:hypothetical protein DUNSADRAFT_773 [Dunaliella salina]|eukprot:KAF5827374.1 hypothetical protein DUNSADRAFT_773 [Dunaliella salina]
MHTISCQDGKGPKPRRGCTYFKGCHSMMMATLAAIHTMYISSRIEAPSFIAGAHGTRNQHHYKRLVSFAHGDKKQCIAGRNRNLATRRWLSHPFLKLYIHQGALTDPLSSQGCFNF